MSTVFAREVSSAWAPLPQSSASAVERVVAAITGKVLCCDCLRRVTGCSDLAVRRSLIAISRMVPLDTWTPCGSCGAIEETYGIRQIGSPLRKVRVETPMTTEASVDSRGVR
jgi:hypothetical protein